MFTANSNRGDKTIFTELEEPAFWGKPAVGEYRVETLTVVGPYPTAGFFEQIDTTLQPRQVVLVVDSAWPEAEVECIRDFLGNRLLVRYADCSGLMHAKLYFVHWRATAHGRSRRHLVLGSGNASLSGFQRNAEAFVSFGLPARHAATRYFDALATAAEVPTTTAKLDKLTLLLPDVQLTDERDTGSFAGWVQRGRLCHQFLRDQSFGKFTIRLKRPLSPGRIAQVFETAGLVAPSKSTTFRWSYLAYASAPGTPTWRSRYFVDTLLGHWTSADCFAAEQQHELGPEDKRVHFYAKDGDKRVRLIETLRASVSGETWIKRFLHVLDSVAAQIEGNGESPETYFDCTVKKSGPKLARSRYRENAQKQYERDKRRIESPIFCRRFESGFEFPRVPPFRGIDATDEGSFEDFLESMCDSLIHEIRKAKVLSWLAQAVRFHRPDLEEAATPEGTEPSGRELLEFLESNWAEVRSDVTGYWENE